MKPALSDSITLISMSNVPKGFMIIEDDEDDRSDLENKWEFNLFLEMKMVHKILPIKNLNVIADFSLLLCTLIAQMMFKNSIFRLSINTGNWLAQSWGTSWA